MVGEGVNDRNTTRIHPKVTVDDQKRRSANCARATKDAPQFDMFADFNGLPDAEGATPARPALVELG